MFVMPGRCARAALGSQGWSPRSPAGPRSTLCSLSPLLSFTCMVAVLSCIVAPVQAADGNGTLTVGVPVDRCPVFYRDLETKEITGIGVDLMRSAAARAGYHVTFRVVEEKNLKDALDNKAYDVVMPFGSAVAGASGHPTIVSDNLMETPFALVTKGRHEMPTMNRLRIGMVGSLGAVAETIRQQYPGIQITLYNTMSEAVDALRADKADALLHNYYVWSYVLQKPSYSNLAG